MDEHLHELEYHESLDGGSYWVCRLIECDYVEFQYEDSTCGR